MKKIAVIYFTVLFLFIYPFTEVVPNPDFIVSDILILNDNFIHIQIENRSVQDCKIKPELYEKIFLTLYINNLRRAEYKLKYMDKKLFKKSGKIIFRTNFRGQNELRIMAEINRLKIIPESNYSNNTLEKKLIIHE